MGLTTAGTDAGAFLYLLKDKSYLVLSFMNQTGYFKIWYVQ